MRSILVAGLILVAACAQEPLRGIDLPPASLPDEIDAEQWAIAFSHEFGRDFWAEGPHVYQMLLDCPAANDAPVDGEFMAFGATGEAPPVDGRVYLRLSGLSTSTLGAPDVQFINPEQETTAILTVVGISADQVEAATECVGEFQYDDGQSAPLEPNEPFRP